jgi:hypothetical protein
VSTASQLLQIANATGFNYSDYGRQFDLQRGPGSCHAAVHPRNVSGRAVYVFEIDRRRIQLHRYRRHTVQFIDNLEPERGLSSFDQRNKLR